MEKQLQKIWGLVYKMAGYDFFSFDSPVEINVTHPTVLIGAITVNKDKSVYLFNGEAWYQLETTDLNYNSISKEIYKHLKLITKNKTPLCQ